jgi:PilZ domain
MKSDIYRLVTVNDGKTDTAAIVKVFDEMAAGRLKCDLKPLNYCDEVPVSYGATVTTVEKDSVELAVHEHQALVIKQDKSTLIKSRHFHNELGVHCYAAYVNVPKKTVILHNFAYAQIRAERREAVRVKVHEPLSVKFAYENVTIEGTMVDISGNGISFHSDLVPATEIDQMGLLYFALSGTPLAVTGSFVKSAPQGSDGHTCIFQMKPDRVSDTVIGRFIYQRQVEIVQQLKEGLVVE